MPSMLGPKTHAGDSARITGRFGVAHEYEDAAGRGDDEAVLGILDLRLIGQVAQMRIDRRADVGFASSLVVC